jgi:drug/metabolite transporter (DMT)-like permease
VRKHIPAFVAFGTVVVWGINFTLLKDSLAQFDVLSFTWLRYAGMLVLAWAVLLLARRPALPPRRDLRRVVAVGTVGYSGYIVLSLVGLSFTTAFSNALLIAAAPLASAVMLWIGRTEPLGGVRLLGLVVGVVGVAVFMSEQLGHGFAAAGLGDLISLLAAILFAAYTVLVKPLAGRHAAPSVSAWTLTAGALPVLVVTAPWLQHQDWTRVHLSGWLLLGWSIVVPVYLAWMLWGWAAARAGVAATNAFLYLVPVASGISSFFVLGEGFGPLKLGGAALVLAGLVLARRRPKPPSATEPAPAGRPRPQPIGPRTTV